MIFLLFLGSFFGSSLLSIGLTSDWEWKQVFGIGHVPKGLSQMLFTAGALICAFTLFLASYFLVLQNSIIVVAIMVLLFAIGRFIIEIMSH